MNNSEETYVDDEGYNDEEYVGIDYSYPLKTKIKGTIKQVTIDDDEKSREWMAYKIIIETDEGTWKITGCHDSSPTIMKKVDHVE